MVHRFSDISGDAPVKPLSSSLDGSTYEIDLMNGELTDLHKALAFCIRTARQVTGKRSANPPRPNNPDLDRIREWASANGYTVAPHGRVAQKVIEAYDAAQKRCPGLADGSDHPCTPGESRMQPPPAGYRG